MFKPLMTGTCRDSWLNGKLNGRGGENVSAIFWANSLTASNSQGDVGLGKKKSSPLTEGLHLAMARSQGIGEPEQICNGQKGKKGPIIGVLHRALRSSEPKEGEKNGSRPGFKAR